MDTFFDLQYNLLMVQNIINDSVVVESFISGESSLQVMSFRRGVAKQKELRQILLLYNHLYLCSQLKDEPLFELGYHHKSCVCYECESYHITLSAFASLQSSWSKSRV